MIHVDHARCVGSAMCVTLAPGAFVLDDGGQSVPVDPDAEITPAIAEAVDACPVQAISVPGAEAR